MLWGREGCGAVMGGLRMLAGGGRWGGFCPSSLLMVQDGPGIAPLTPVPRVKPAMRWKVVCWLLDASIEDRERHVSCHVLEMVFWVTQRGSARTVHGAC